MTATQTTAIYHVGTPEEPAQKNPPITANSAEAAARKYVNRGDWGDAESVTVTVYEDDDGRPDGTRYSDITVAIIYGVADINARCRAAGISPREFWEDVMGGGRAPLPAADVHHAIAGLGGGR